MDLCRPASLDKPIITQARLLFAMKRLVVLTVLASFIFAVGGQTTLSSGKFMRLRIKWGVLGLEAPPTQFLYFSYCRASSEIRN